MWILLLSIQQNADIYTHQIKIIKSGRRDTESIGFDPEMNCVRMMWGLCASTVALCRKELSTHTFWSLWNHLEA